MGIADVELGQEKLLTLVNGYEQNLFVIGSSFS